MWKDSPFVIESLPYISSDDIDIAILDIAKLCSFEGFIPSLFYLPFLFQFIDGVLRMRAMAGWGNGPVPINLHVHRAPRVN